MTTNTHNTSYPETLEQLNQLHTELESRRYELRHQSLSLESTLRLLHEKRLHYNVDVSVNEKRRESLSAARQEILDHQESASQDYQNRVSNLREQVSDLDSLIALAHEKNDWHSAMTLEHRKWLVQDQINEAENRWNSLKFEIDMMIDNRQRQSDEVDQHLFQVYQEQNHNHQAIQETQMNLDQTKIESEQVESEYFSVSMALFALSGVPVPPSDQVNDGTHEDPVPTEPVPNEDKPVEDQPIEDPPIEDKPVEDPAIEDKPVEDPAIEDKPVEDPAIEDKPVEDPAIEDPASTEPIPNEEPVPIEDPVPAEEPVTTDPAPEEPNTV